MSDLPLLSEHQAPGSDAGSTKPASYTPTAEEKKDIKLINKLYGKAKAHRKKYDEHWPDYYKMFRGKQWKEARPSYRHAEVINFIFQAIQSTVPIMTDARARWDFLPQEPGDIEIAKILSEVSESDWERGNWLMKLSENIYDSHFYGTGLGEMGFNPKARGGTGAITFKSKDVMYVFPDPAAKDFNDEERSCRYVIDAEPVDIETLKREYPKHREYIKPDLEDLTQADKTDLDQVRYKSPVDTRTVLEGSSAKESGSRDQALKITLWTYSDEFVEEEKAISDVSGEQQIDPVTGKPKVEYVQRLKYPNGRKLVLAGGCLVEGNENPYDDGLLPFGRLVNYILPREFWGMSEVEQLQSPQKIFNKLVSFSLDVLTLMGNPIWVVGTGSGVDTDNLFNRPGLVVEADDITQVKREEGVQLQPYVLQLIDRMQTWFQDISGRGDVTQGVNPAGVTAASAITQLQEAANTRIRQKSRNLDAYLQSMGQLYKNRVFQFYRSPQIIRLTNNQNAQKYFKFHIEHVKDPATGEPAMTQAGQPQYKATVRNFTQAPDGTYAEDLQAKEYLIRGDFDVRVATGSSLPFAKAEKVKLAETLFDRGAIDELELLQAAEYPNYEAVWQRVSERREQKMQQEAQAAAAAKAPPAGPPAA